ncbi:4Fe-4S dicluster domain-containing protein [Fundidesulfovibrio soli]|uniref:4Fe-4S dicluster domain-containing protein n=1 Tax=Fundidesulfovibrio soli TaxID=2922716 RepID=UPI001FAEA8C0|nr:4Fe-4S dicluster domain-containing protein [Fundidesulfovibrio soli]
MSSPVWGMVIDVDACTGCGSCMAACRVENNVAPGSRMDWITLERRTNGLQFPDSDAAFLPRPCMHCANPPCVPVCPTGATRVSSLGGIVSQTTPQCIGCRSCVKACPYGVRRFNEREPVWPKGMDAAVTPFAAVRPKGVVEKCTFCVHRLIAHGPEGYTTACAEACPTGAITFGDVSGLRLGGDMFALLPESGAGPRVAYVSRRSWLRGRG